MLDSFFDFKSLIARTIIAVRNPVVAWVENVEKVNHPKAWFAPSHGLGSAKPGGRNSFRNTKSVCHQKK